MKKPEKKVELKIVLVGDAASGKTTFVEKYASGKFLEDYQPTRVAHIYPVQFWTNYGSVDVQVWDTPSQVLFLYSLLN